MYPCLRWTKRGALDLCVESASVFDIFRDLMDLWGQEGSRANL